MTERQYLANKIHEEYDTFIESWKHCVPNSIIAAASEIAAKYDIMYRFTLDVVDTLTDRQVTALLDVDDLLEELYKNWIEKTQKISDCMRKSISAYAKDSIRCHLPSQKQQMMEYNKAMMRSSPNDILISTDGLSEESKQLIEKFRAAGLVTREPFKRHAKAAGEAHKTERR